VKQPKRETVQGWAGRWLSVFPRGSESTNLHYAERVTAFVREYGDRRLFEVSVEDAERFALEHPQRARSVRIMFSDAVKVGADGLTASPFRSVRMADRGEGRRRIYPLTEAEVGRLVGLASGDTWGAQVYGPMVLMAAWTGLRPGELFGLEWRDVDWERSTVHVRRQWNSRARELTATKGKHDRTVPLAPQVVEALRQVPRVRDFVFFTGQDRVRFSQASGVYYWRPVRDAFTAGLDAGHWLAQRVRDGGKALDFYELRHFFASELYRRRVHIGDIAAMLGHEDEGELAKITYVHVLPDEAKDRVRAALWGSEASPKPREASEGRRRTSGPVRRSVRSDGG
jgi:integrase